MSKTVSLFDELLNEVHYDLSTYFGSLWLNKTGRKLSDESISQLLESGTGSYEILSHSMEILSECPTYWEDFPLPDSRSFDLRRLAALCALLPGLRKRYIGPTGAVVSTLKERDDIALQEFVNSNNRCKEYNRSFNYWKLPEFVQLVVGETSKSLYNSCVASPHGFCYDAINQGVLVGPGANSDVSTPAGSFSRLAEGPMSFSSREVAGIYSFISRCSWLTHSSEKYRKSVWGVQDSFSSTASFLAVPKTNKKSRGICKQPSGNMALQLATHSWLSTVLRKSYDVCLDTQQLYNRELARKGSLVTYTAESRTWRFCTIDLSDASNFPLTLLRLLFPVNVAEWCEAIRSPTMLLPDGSIVEKHMCSTMGNGFTFSLMTLMLSALVRSLYTLAQLPEYDSDRVGKFKTWGVYGDDIIVDVSVFEGLKKVLGALGFQLNQSKTFSPRDDGSHDPLFRESCGADWLDGYPVRPVFCESLQTQGEIYSLLNRLALWGTFHSVPLPRSLRLLRKAASDGQTEFRVPNNEDLSAGLHVPKCCAYPSVYHPAFKQLDGIAYRRLSPKRVSKLLFKEKVKIIRYSDIVSRQELSYPSVDSIQWYTENHVGVLMYTIGGFLTAGQYGVRPFGQTLVPTIGYTPGWGDPTVFDGSSSVFNRHRQRFYRLWEDYVLKNLFSRSALSDCKIRS